MIPADALPLTQARPGQPLRLIKIGGGRRLRHRLAEMGLTPGLEFSVLHAHGGPLLLAVRDYRLAVGRGMAEQIFVQPSGVEG